jgi:transposase, IS5 family
LDFRHPLVRLSEELDWEVFTEAFGPLYDAEQGRPGLPIRLLVGLHYLKHAFDLSDEGGAALGGESPWQYFCGDDYFQHRLPLDGSQMSRFRGRIGEAGCELMLKATVTTGLSTQALSRTDVAGK